MGKGEGKPVESWVGNPGDRTVGISDGKPGREDWNGYTWYCSWEIGGEWLWLDSRKLGWEARGKNSRDFGREARKGYTRYSSRGIGGEGQR